MLLCCFVRVVCLLLGFCLFILVVVWRWVIGLFACLIAYCFVFWLVLGICVIICFKLLLVVVVCCVVLTYICLVSCFVVGVWLLHLSLFCCLMTVVCLLLVAGDLDMWVVLGLLVVFMFSSTYRIGLLVWLLWWLGMFDLVCWWFI